MTMVSQYNEKSGVVDRVMRHDAVPHFGRHICPTTEATRWVSTWNEFLVAGGTVCFNEDQTELELLLPAPFKFSIKFQR